ncbi:4620_t:CDS:10 [Acaulospora morrowiae]|uniref:4620_t:CDS:1 n=1 Tax=Acaulospora morrowiae TaxID=94023 RepID=A0A9N8Z3H8_9GLOM|nr:4620_t:CDS:10 [Acaulospora morrowiae]
MSSKWCAYFNETEPKEYRFLGFYEYRSKQVDFTFSFQKESYKLQMDLDNLMKDGSEEAKETATEGVLIATGTMECCLPYGRNVRYRKMDLCVRKWNPYNYGGQWNAVYLTVGMSVVPAFRSGHRDTFRGVNAFWNKIELSRRLQDRLQTAEVKATSSLIDVSVKIFATTTRNVRSAIENVHNTLAITGTENPKKRSAEEASLISTPPNLRDRSPPSCYNGNNFLNDYNEESTEVVDASPTNDYESDVEITRKEDGNPFDARKDEGLTRYKVVLSWKHAINNMNINNFSENDWVTRDGHNISIDFRNFQLKSIEKLEANPTLSYAKDIDLILCLSSIMYCNELKPKYVECSEKAWNEARPRSLIPKELPTVADLAIIEYSRILNDKQLLITKWRNNWTKGNTLLTDEDKEIFDCVQTVSRNFFTYLSSVSYNEDKKLDEDTFIHRYCHQILEEIFNKADFSLVWANGESESSKERRLLDGHNHGRKSDFRILSKIDDTEREFVFDEIKSPHCFNTVNKSLIKLAEFMKGSLDFIINTYGYVAGLEMYGILICVYDGLYRCNLLSKVLFPTESANFVNIVTVVSTLYSLLERTRSTINIINSSQLTTHSSPKILRVPIVRV